MAVFPGDCSFSEISRSIFRVETSYGTTAAFGTGFVIAKFAQSQKLVLATAKHVLDLPENETVQWKVQQFNDEGEIAREVRFATNAKLKGNVPYRTHNTLDVGICVLPALGTNNQTLALPDEQPVRPIDMLSGATTGTRVAWAGFPGTVEAALGFPHLCYFEGVISAMVNCKDRNLYIVDGHAAQGVSGGPVWHWSEEKNRLEVIGIVCQYHHTATPLPGYCLFEPINPIIYFLHSEAWHPDITGEHLIINRYG